MYGWGGESVCMAGGRECVARGVHGWGSCMVGRVYMAGGMCMTGGVCMAEGVWMVGACLAGGGCVGGHAWLGTCVAVGCTWLGRGHV